MKYVISFYLGCFTSLLAGQEYVTFDSRYETYQSVWANDSFHLDIHIPYAEAYGSEKLSYPLIILLDNQSENTHRHNISSIDILTMHDQMPASVVVGVGFRWDNRSYLTSSAVKPGDSLSGLQRTSGLIFEELIPELRVKYRATGPILIIGHSRTAYLSTYLMISHAGQFNAAGSFSGFTESWITSDTIRNTINTLEDKKQPFRWFFSAGSKNPEEAAYLEDFRRVSNQLRELGALDYAQWHYSEHPAAGHMANYNLSVPEMMVLFFAPYSSVLNDWLFYKLDEWSGKNEDIVKASPAKALVADLDKAGQKIDAQFVPQLVQVVSMANYFYNSEKYEWALDILLLGMEYYPGDYDVNYMSCLTYYKLGNTYQVQRLKQLNLERIKADANLDSEEKQEYTGIFEEIEL